ncbi:uncharacterized protein B0H18DRAFT_660874 [Fomitopsis serialis]|uniref:uncharacterized protein n=1 Tax=Fomitopsis serialis TaxID=139415 RepID=UPI0020078C2C|nr:uncharacterized protein B0H18DRAFT_660874 [Neoantrodia serialis]KAH9918859.1 hypothetical protein B0H18DRAFT_660874 [Neoantrodia serialis]
MVDTQYASRLSKASQDRFAVIRTELCLSSSTFSPRYLSTTPVFSPFLIDPLSTARTKSSSLPKACALPVKPRPSGREATAKDTTIGGSVDVRHLG